MFERNPNNISSYQDLIQAKKDLKKDITSIEDDLKDNNFVKLSSFVIGSKFNKKSVFNSFKFSDVLSSPIGQFTGTFLLSNKTIRKYFIAFVIVKETYPYALERFKSILNENLFKK